MKALLPKPPFHPTEAERRNFGVRPEVSLSAWSEQHVRITEGPLVEGAGSIPWSPETFALQRAVMESIEDGRWSRTIGMTAPQAFGKTQCAAVPVLLYALAYRRVSTFYVAANAQLAVTQWRKKIEPAMKADPLLAQLFYANPDFGGTKERRDFTNGTSLHMTGSESVGSLSGFTAPVGICDDVQAYPDNLVRFGHPADYATSRTEAFPSESVTLVFMGTAGTVEDWLWRSLNSSTFYCPFVPCPRCQTYQLIEFERMVFDTEDPQAAVADTWMRCANPDCTHHIVFDELPAMLGQHLWVSMPPDAQWITKPPESGVRIDLEAAEVYPDTARNTNEAGFWCNAFYWPLGKTWGDRAAEWIGLRGDPDKEKTWQQNIVVRPWEEPELDEDRLTPELVAEHKTDGHHHQTVPAEADTVTITCDVHARFLYYIVRAWRRRDGETWLVDAGSLGVHGPEKGERLSETEQEVRVGAAIQEALNDLWDMEHKGWPHGSSIIHARYVIIDGGYRPDAVGPFCMRAGLGKWRMIKGEAGKRPILPPKVSRPQRGYPMWFIGVDPAKHKLRDLMSIPRGRPGYWHAYSDKDLASYDRHMASERWEARTNTKGQDVMSWCKVKNAGPNHWWDCETYGIAAAMMADVRLLGEPEPAKPRTDYFAKQHKV